MESLPRIALVTPLKNEIGNIPSLMECIQAQTTPITYWIVVENGSNDGSKEFLERLKSVPNVEHFVVLNFTLPNDTYELGHKYATVVNQGFEYLKRKELFSSLDFVGILDADCFPTPHYYKQLTSFMLQNSQLGISSGIGYTLEGKHDGEASEWVRGNCRLWKTACFLDAGYIIGPSADTLSLCKAQLKGWQAIPDSTLVYHCREMGKKVNYSYYGYSSYYRGITPLYASIKFFKLVSLGQMAQASAYFRGYADSYRQGKERIPDMEIRQYFSQYLFKKMNTWK